MFQLTSPRPAVSRNEQVIHAAKQWIGCSSADAWPNCSSVFLCERKKTNDNSRIMDVRLFDRPGPWMAPSAGHGCPKARMVSLRTTGPTATTQRRTRSGAPCGRVFRDQFSVFRRSELYGANASSSRGSGASNGRCPMRNVDFGMRSCITIACCFNWR